MKECGKSFRAADIDELASEVAIRKGSYSQFEDILTKLYAASFLPNDLGHLGRRKCNDVTLLARPWRLIVPEKKEWLAVKLFNLIEGEAQGRWVIMALFAVILLVVFVSRFS